MEVRNGTLIKELLQGNIISVLEKLKTNGLLETKFQVLTIHQNILKL
jgi:hypothetical protein